MDLRHAKRILILGSQKNSNIILDLIKNSKKKWNIIYSYQDRKQFYEGNENVINKTYAYKDIKGKNIETLKDINIPLVIDNVIAPTFFDLDWVKNQIKMNPDLILVTSAPHKNIEENIRKQFDMILFSQTDSVELQTQYHTLYMDAKKCDFKVFSKQLSSLEKNQYLIDKQGIALEKFVLEKEEDVPIPSPQKEEDDIKDDDEHIYIICVPKNGDYKMIKDSFYTNILQTNTMIGLMIRSMNVEERDGGKKVCFSFFVNSPKSDLFISLMVSAFKSFKKANLIKKVSIQF